MRWPIFLISFSVALSLSCSPSPFTQEECETLLHRVDELTLEPLSQAQRNTLSPLFETHTGALSACVEGRSWSREGMECVLKASDGESLALCLEVNRNALQTSAH